jgi:hypothetical protein
VLISEVVIERNKLRHAVRLDSVYELIVVPNHFPHYVRKLDPPDVPRVAFIIEK